MVAWLELKNCPFCGGEPNRHINMVDRRADGFNSFFRHIVCDDCGSSGPVMQDNLISDSIGERWNARASLADAPESPKPKNTGIRDQKQIGDDYEA